MKKIITFTKNTARGFDCKRTYFEKVLKYKTSKCRLFHLTHDMRYGYSPDAFGLVRFLLEVKTLSVSVAVLCVPMQNFAFCSHIIQNLKLQFVL